MRFFSEKKIEIYLKSLFFSNHLSLKRRAMRFYNKPVEPEIRIVNTLVDKKLASVDIGVYRGVYSYFLLKYSSHVYSFEANPILIKLLIDTFKKYKAITIENFAISSLSGSINLRIPYRDNKLNYTNDEEKYELGLATVHKNNNLNKKKYKEFNVKKIAIDDYNFKHPLGFIKIDVEGHELEIIKGAIKTIKKFKPNLLIEIEAQHSGIKQIETINYIKSLGYDCFILDHKNYSLIVINSENIDNYSNYNFTNYNNYNFIFKPSNQ